MMAIRRLFGKEAGRPGKQRIILRHKRIVITAKNIKSKHKGIPKHKQPFQIIHRKKSGKVEKKKERSSEIKKKHEERSIVYRKPASGITTEIDDMLQMVSEKRKIKIDRMAKSLKVSEDQIQDWAKILEEQGLVRIHYPAIGKPEIRIGTEKIK